MNSFLADDVLKLNLQSLNFKPDIAQEIVHDRLIPISLEPEVGMPFITTSNLYV